MKEPLISIVMVNYNHEDTIGDSIESVISQTYKNWELIIIDDGSTDASAAIIGEYADRDRRIRFYPQKKNQQICVATNIGFSYVTGEYVARLDSDDIWLPEKLERQLARMEEAPWGSLCFTKLDVIDGEGRIVNEALSDYYQAYNRRQNGCGGWLKYFFFSGNTLIQSTLLMKREVLQSLGGFHLAYMQAHDFDFFVRAAKRYEFIFVEEPLVKYRRTEKQNSACNEEKNRRFFNEHMLIRRHFFEEMPDDLFIEAFGDCFVNKASSTHEELLCEQAFLLCRCVGDQENTPVLGLQRIEELMENPETARVLEDVFHYTPKDYYRQTDKRLYITDDLVCELEYLRRLSAMQEERIRQMEESSQKMWDQLEQYQQTIAEQYQTIVEQQDVIHQMQESASWKITKPLRSVKKVLTKG